MKLSDKGLQLLKQLEGCRLKPYDDQTGRAIDEWCKGATIGYGHLISPDDWGMFKRGITKEEAAKLLLSDLEVFEQVVPLLPPNQFDACVLLAFNIGTNAFTSSTVYKYLTRPEYRSKKYPTLEQAWKAWNKSQGSVMQGLVNRREAEWRLYSS